jgi:hypothetical protein
MKARLRNLCATVSLVGAIAAASTTPTALASNPEVGPYAQSVVTCMSAAWSFAPQGTISMSPLVGASTMYTRQTVAWQFYVRNARTGTGFFVQPGWKSMVHERVTYQTVFDPWSPTGTRSQPSITKYANAASSSVDLAPGQYIVFTQYAWWTSIGWVYSEWVQNTSYTQNGIPSSLCVM